MQGVRGGWHLPAPAPEEHMQGVRGRGHLPAPAPEERMQGVRGREHLPAPAHQERMQGVWQGEHLPAPAREEQMQGVSRGGGQVDAGWPGGVRGSWYECCRIRWSDECAVVSWLNLRIEQLENLLISKS